MKYGKNFERDFVWFMKYKDVFNFDASDCTGDKVVYSEAGLSSKECFYLFDSQGRVIPTSEPELLFSLHKAKGGINFQIKQWAESRAKGELGLLEFNDISKEYELLDWMIKAVENQKINLYKVC